MTSSIISRIGRAPEEGIKAPCRVETDANITLSGHQTINGVLTTDEMRVLVKDQTDAAENGIYLASQNAWERATDLNQQNDAFNGVLVISEETGQLYRFSFTSPWIPETTDITFVPYDITGAGLDTQVLYNVGGNVTGSAALTFNGNTLTVGDATGAAALTLNADAALSPILRFSQEGSGIAFIQYVEANEALTLDTIGVGTTVEISANGGAPITVNASGTLSVGGNNLLVGAGNSTVGLTMNAGPAADIDLIFQINDVEQARMKYDNSADGFDFQNIALFTMGNYTFDVDQVVGAGQDNYLLTYDNATGLISLEAPAGGGGTPGGADTQMQYNNGGSFGGIAQFTYDDGNPTIGDLFTMVPNAALTSGSILDITANLAGMTGTLVNLHQDNATSTADTLTLTQDNASGAFALNVIGSGGFPRVAQAGNHAFNIVDGGLQLATIAGSPDLFQLRPEHAWNGSGDETVASSTTLTDSTNVSVSVTPNTYYMFWGVLRFDRASAGAATVKWNIITKNGAANVNGIAHTFDGSAGPGAVSTAPLYKSDATGLLESADIQVGVDNADESCSVIHGYIQTSAGCDEITVQFAQTVSNAIAVRLKLGSFLTLNRI